MNIFLRAIAILAEVLILAALIYVLLRALQLTVFELGLESKYKKIVVIALVLTGSMAIIFFIAHLILFYPTI
jgi:hypothetical protein